MQVTQSGMNISSFRKVIKARDTSISSVQDEFEIQVSNNDPSLFDSSDQIDYLPHAILKKHQNQRFKVGSSQGQRSGLKEVMTATNFG